MTKTLSVKHTLLKNLIQLVAIDGFWPDNGNYIPIVPDCMAALIINIGDPYERTQPGTGKLSLVSGSHFIGIKTKPCYVKPVPGMKTISIRFRPGSLPFFINPNLHELTDHVIDAALLFGRDIGILEEQFSEEDNPYSILSKVEAFLLARLNLNHRPGDTFHKIKTIYQDPVNCKMEDLINENISYKKLERHFLKNVGMAPKKFIDIVRFNYATSLLLAKPEISFTEATYKAGYYDQSHFIRVFKKRAGYAPGKYVTQKAPMFLDNQRIIAEEFKFSALRIPR